MQRREEIAAKKARLAELKRQNELRSKEFAVARQNLSSTSTPPRGTPSPARGVESRQEVDNLVSSLVGDERAGPTTPRSRGSPYGRGSGRKSEAAAEQGGEADGEERALDERQSEGKGYVSSSMQTLSFSSLTTVYEIQSEPPKKEVLTYSKGIQTVGLSDSSSRDSSRSRSDDDVRSMSRSGRSRRRSSRRQKEREEELRQNLRKEIEEELKSIKLSAQSDPEMVDGTKQPQNFPARALSNEELDAVTSSNDFLDFVERSSKIIERALDEEYDLLADYRFGNLSLNDEDDELNGTTGRKGRRVKELVQFYDERWSKKRMISDINFSPKFPELLLSSHTKNPSAPYDPSGLVQVWNQHMHSRPEYIFHATSDVLTARFSPFHPNLILGGSYSGQVLIWDTRARSAAPVQKTPLTGTGQGHTHPIYNINIVGTQNAHNVISTSTDGIVCSWSIDMMSQPQEYLELTTPPAPQLSSTSTSSTTAASSSIQTTLSRNPTQSRPEDLAPTSIAFPSSDPTYFLSGTEEGSIHLCHRYDRAGAKAGVDPSITYKGHAAPVMSLDFHSATGPFDLGDLVLSTGLDWCIRLWRVRTPAAARIESNNLTNNTNTLGGIRDVTPLLEIIRDDAVYDAKWSPTRPGVFASVDGAGFLEVWDFNQDNEVPVARVAPSQRNLGLGGLDSTNASAAGGAGAGAGGMNGIGGIAGGLNTGGFSSMSAASGMGMRRGLNRCAWEMGEGKRIAVGGLDGAVTVFEVGNELGGTEGVKQEEWVGVRKMVTRLEGR